MAQPCIRYGPSTLTPERLPSPVETPPRNARASKSLGGLPALKYHPQCQRWYSSGPRLSYETEPIHPVNSTVPTMSGQGTSIVVSIPGKPDWHMRVGNGWGNFQLDIVGFLAVLGEGSVTANAQVSALSPLFYLPRLIPAPQALLWPKRPVELEPTKASVTGVESGIVKEHVHHVANVLL